MRTLVLVLLTCLMAFPAHALDRFSIEPLPTSYGGNDGFTLRAESTGESAEEFFLYEANGLVTFGAAREVPDPFEAIASGAALVPIAPVVTPPGGTFPFLEDCSAQTATYMGMIEITVPAGTFMTYRFDVGDSCTPGAVERFYWADGVGLVRIAAYNEFGEFDDASVLSTYTINGGTGLFPRAMGNEWNFTAGTVETETGSVGTLKARFGD